MICKLYVYGRFIIIIFIRIRNINQYKQEKYLRCNFQLKNGEIKCAIAKKNPVRHSHKIK